MRRNRVWFIAQDAAHSTLIQLLTVQTVERHLSIAENRPYSRYERRGTITANDYRHRQSGSGIGLLIVGLFIIIIGVSSILLVLPLFWNYFWPIVLVLVGLWILLLGFETQPQIQTSATPITSLYFVNSTVLDCTFLQLCTQKSYINSHERCRLMRGNAWLSTFS